MARTRICLLFTLIARYCLVFASENSSNHLSKLRHQLLDNYDSAVRPTNGHQHHRISVELDVTLIKIIQLDSKSQIFTVEIWLWLRWQDEQLSWNPLASDNVSELRLAIKDIWTPDIIAYNGVGDSNLPTSPEQRGHLANVQSSGQVTLVVPRTLSVFCPTGDNLKNFPRDVHECALVFGSASHHLGQLDILPAAHPHPIAPSWDENAPEWTVLGNWTRRDQGHWGNATWATISHKFKLSRTLSTYSRFIEYLTYIAVAGTLIVFILPPRFIGQRFLITIAALLASVFLIADINERVGISSEINIIRFLLIVIAINGLSLFQTLVVYFLSSKCYSTALPMRLASAVNGPFGKLLGLELTGITYDLKTEMSKQDEGSGQQLCLVLQEEWILFAVLLDRLALTASIICFLSTYPK